MEFLQPTPRQDRAVADHMTRTDLMAFRAPAPDIAAQLHALSAAWPEFFSVPHDAQTIPGYYANCFGVNLEWERLEFDEDGQPRRVTWRLIRDALESRLELLGWALRYHATTHNMPHHCAQVYAGCGAAAALHQGYGPHLSAALLDAVTRALTQPPAEPERWPGLLADYIEAERDEPADMPVGVESATLEDARHALLTLDPAHLRALAVPQPTPEQEPCETCAHVTDNLGQVNYCYRCGRKFPEHQVQSISLEELVALEAPKWADVPDPVAWVRGMRGDEPDGAQVRHRKSGGLYTLIGPGKHKALGERWVEVMLYRNADGELFSREVANFEESFERLAQAGAEGAE